MLVLLSCAKTMSAVSKVKVPLTTSPRFQKEAAEIALQMSQFSVDELERLLRVNAKIAVENYKRYQSFSCGSYSGITGFAGLYRNRIQAPQSERFLCGGL